MYHDIIKGKIRRQSILHEAMLELTYKCNLDCFFCYNDRKLEGRPLSVADYETLLDDLERMGVLFIVLTGGEPLIHPHFYEIGRAARDRGFAIRVKTGAHGLHGRTAERLKAEVNPLQTEISLHGATAEAHDRQTQVPGSFDKLIVAIPELLALDLRPSFVTTLTAWNEHQVEQMFSLSDQLGVRLRFQGPVAPRDDGDTSPFAIQPSRAGWEKVTEIAKRRREEVPVEMDCSSKGRVNEPGELKPHCGVGSEEVLVDPYGSVFPCLHVRRSAGNVHQDSIEEIWKSYVFRDARQLSLDSAKRLKEEGPLHLFDAPVFCPGLEEKGCSCSTPDQRAASPVDSSLVQLGSLS